MGLWKLVTAHTSAFFELAIVGVEEHLRRVTGTAVFCMCVDVVADVQCGGAPLANSNDTRATSPTQSASTTTLMLLLHRYVCVYSSPLNCA